jgi:hypothetical protein
MRATASRLAAARARASTTFATDGSSDPGRGSCWFLGIAAVSGCKHRGVGPGPCTVTSRSPGLCPAPADRFRIQASAPEVRPRGAAAHPQPTHGPGVEKALLGRADPKSLSIKYKLSTENTESRMFSMRARRKPGFSFECNRLRGMEREDWPSLVDSLPIQCVPYAGVQLALFRGYQK